MQTEANSAEGHGPAISIWLWCLFATLFALVLIGGITRLTGSGLSMVDWRPLMGVLPPIGEAQWREVFDAYKTSPQYREVNQWMELADFKRIFFWEYFHRMMGRAIGLVAFLPWVYFSLRGRLQGWLSFRVIVAILLGGAQGLLGWYMVQSGLVDRPEVSHLRLAAHLLLAFFIAQWVLFTLLDLRWGRAGTLFNQQTLPVIGLVGLIAVQILYGAFMAGTNAGVLFPTFPDMNGHYAPGPFFPHASLAQNLLYSPVAIHYTHRVLGFALVAYAAGLLFVQRRSQLSPNWAQYQFGMVLLLQFVLGAATALYRAPLPFAIAHQAVAFALVCSATLLAHRTIATRTG
jgi:cytochrome c oxidase assembly protein subunit 15